MGAFIFESRAFLRHLFHKNVHIRTNRKRRHPDSNWGMEVLQTSALPLGYAAALDNAKVRMRLANYITQDSNDGNFI